MDVVIGLALSCVGLGYTLGWWLRGKWEHKIYRTLHDARGVPYWTKNRGR